MINVLACDILVSEFELKSRYDVHFRTNTCSIVSIWDTPIKAVTLYQPVFNKCRSPAIFSTRCPRRNNGVVDKNLNNTDRTVP